MKKKQKWICIACNTSGTGEPFHRVGCPYVYSLKKNKELIVKENIVEKKLDKIIKILNAKL